MVPDNREPLLQYLNVQTKMDAQLRRLLVEAAITTARKIQKLASQPGIGSKTREAQLALFLEYLREEQTDLWVRTIEPLINKYYPIAATTAETAADYLDDVLRHAVGETQADILIQSIKIQARIAQSLDLSSRAQRLSGKVWKNVNVNSGRIQRVVQKHLITGSVNAKELAADVRRFIDPSTPGGASYAAMRLARTEINGAFHDRQRTIAEETPWVSGSKWNLSKSHPHKDECDVLAEGHSTGMKRGIYRPSDIPDKPHPHCLCYLTYDTLSDGEMTNLLRAELGKAPLVA
jgi:hypothetical protein